jgi:prolyl-tRNA synthetase
MKWSDLATEIPHMLDRIHNDMYARAKETRDAHMKEATNWEQFMEALNGKNIVQTPWCNVNACELKTKERSKVESEKLMEEAGDEEEVLTGSAKTLCLPFQPKTPLKAGDVCF